MEIALQMSNCLPLHRLSSELNGTGGSVNTSVNRSKQNINVTTSVTIGNVTKSSISKIKLASNVKQSHVTDKSANVIASNMDASGNKSVKITSAFREPAKQANAMFNNIESKGVESQKRLYGSNGDQVIEVYENAHTVENIASETITALTGVSVNVEFSDTAIKSMMTNKINELGPGNVSKHSSNPNVLNVIDISPRSVKNLSSLTKSFQNDSNVSKVIPVGNDPALHIEIPQIK